MIASILSPVPEDTVSNVCDDGENVNEMVNFKFGLIYFSILSVIAMQTFFNAVTLEDSGSIIGSSKSAATSL